MRMIISPAKKMNVDTDSFAVEAPPRFLAETRRLMEALKALSGQELQALWKCSGAIARQNVERLESMDLDRNLTPAILAYEGIQYRSMAPNVMEAGELDYLRQNLRILSGFYGLLRPFDGVTPYRLEMQAKLAVGGCRDLYQFWDGLPARQLAAETDLVLNLASKEYSKAVIPHLPGAVRLVSCVFGELKNGKIAEKGTRCKMARGQMVRWLAENHVTDPADFQAFEQLGCRFWRAEAEGTHTTLYFTMESKHDGAADR